MLKSKTLNMKHYKLIGLISSIILVINYIIIGPAITFNFVDNWFNSFIGIHKTFIFPIAFMGFYYALYKLVQKFEIKKFTIPVLVLLGLGCISLILNMSRFLGINTLDILSGLPAIANMLVFILWAVLVIRSKDVRFKRIRNFAKSMLIGHLIVFIFTLINMFLRSFFYESGYQPFEFINIAYAVYGVGYFFGLLIFVEKLKNTNS